MGLNFHLGQDCMKNLDKVMRAMAELFIPALALLESISSDCTGISR